MLVSVSIVGSYFFKDVLFQRHYNYYINLYLSYFAFFTGGERIHFYSILLNINQNITSEEDY